MPIVSLTTDFGEKDYSVSAIKASLHIEIPEARVIDVSHQISPFNHTEASYILKNAYTAFPKGSIHVLGVDSERTQEVSHVAMLLNGHYFIGADNGVFSLIAEETQPEKIVEINIHQNLVSSFPVLDVFVKVAGHLARNGQLEVIGKTIQNVKKVTGLNPVVAPEGNALMGSIIYIDNYGNVVTNITKKQFQEVGKSRDFTIFARTVKFHKIVNHYSEAIDFSLPAGKRDEDGKKIALFNTAGHLELAIYKSNPLTVGSAHSLFGLDYRDPITIEFY
jgi:S-adenosylmethionine hydrolase